MLTAILSILFLSFIAGQAASSEVFFYVDRSGTVHFSDTQRHNYLKYRSKHDLPAAPGRENQYEQIIRRSAKKYSVDPALIKAMIKAESNFDPHAISPVGALGLMQLMPETAAQLSATDVLNPHVNIDAGTRYMKVLLNEFKGNIRLSLAAYNAGADNVRRFYKVPPFDETKTYVSRVFAYYKQYRKEWSGRTTGALNTGRNEDGIKAKQ
jgi:soluble lytic murein transglycosylase-like protein